MATVCQNLDDFKLDTPYEPKKVKEYREKAKKAMRNKCYKKAYKYLHKAKTWKEIKPKIVMVDEFYMLYDKKKEKIYSKIAEGKTKNA